MNVLNGLAGGIVGGEMTRVVSGLIDATLAISQQDLLGKLASVLPQVVDKMTPGGAVLGHQP